MNDVLHNWLDTAGVPLLAGWFLFLTIAETVSALRVRKQNRWSRLWINILVSIPGFVTLRFVLLISLVWLARQNQQWQIGVLYLVPMPVWLGWAVAFLLLDYTIYVWHLLNHKVPFLWRFHLVHHTDVDLDASTAIRFHFGEIIASVFFRGAAVVLTGATPLMVIVYEIIFEAATQFHHSNWKIPLPLERVLNRIIVTPRMHGIHHSVIRNETDTNYSVIFSWWDRLHETMKLNIRQADITIGVPVYSDAKELSVWYLLTLPFTRIRPWKAKAPARNEEEKNFLRD
jgi:sterol desaturase/sphingolipid hydroxylase (fatty acid hydroxylase superfamily)